MGKQDLIPKGTQVGYHVFSYLVIVSRVRRGARIEA